MTLQEFFLGLSPFSQLVIILEALGIFCFVWWALTETFLWADARYRAAQFRYQVLKNKEINARADTLLDAARKRRAFSSTCAEHLALNQKVPGSNPGGPTNSYKENDVKRRITWHLERSTAIAMSDGDVLPTKFQWRNLPRPDAILPGHGERRGCREFHEDEHKVRLLWDGIQMETFLNEVVLKQFIIRMVYMIGNSELVPSELLAEANLVYADDWVDEWGCRDKNDDVIECSGEISRPADRKIKIMHRGGSPIFGARKHQSVKPRIHAFINRWKAPVPIEIPDEKCFYSFRAGGFYEKDQKPLEDACEKGEKEV